MIVHTILGLPGEGQEEVFATMDYLNGLSISGIKLQLLHVLKTRILRRTTRPENLRCWSRMRILPLSLTACGASVPIL